MIPLSPESLSSVSLAALRRGDADAWRALFETYAEPLYLYAYHRLGDAVLAEDVRQETFLSAIENIDRYRGDAPLFGWLCGIARHKSQDAARKQAQQSVRETALEPSALDMAGDEDLYLPDRSAPAPEDCLVTGEQRAAVVEALWSLPEAYRRALVWRYARSEPVDRIAERMEKSYKSVESLLSRARAALREQLGALHGREDAE